jgi:hypothetical protein
MGVLMAWQRWNPATRTLFRRVTIEENREEWNDKTDVEKNFTRGLFDYGFVRARISSPVRIEARNLYFDEMDIDPADFDWNAWRRYMGYDEDSD